MIKLLTLMTQLCTVSAAILTYLAHQWSVEAYGLNPLIALPLATLCMILPYVIDSYFIESEPQDKNASTINLRKPK